MWLYSLRKSQYTNKHSWQKAKLTESTAPIKFQSHINNYEDDLQVMDLLGRLSDIALLESTALGVDGAAPAPVIM